MATPQELADQNMLAIKRVTDAVTSFVTRAWWALTDYHDPARFVEQVVPMILAGQQQVASLTDAYLSQLLTEATGSFVAPLAPAAELVTDLRAGVSLAEAYERPLRTTWWRQSSGVEFPDALRQGLQRAEAMVSLDMQMARTHASALVLMNEDGIKRYQRVLSGSENCDLCETAAKHIYKKTSLLPIHAKCDCTVMPVIEGRPPLANRINEDRTVVTKDQTPQKEIGVESHNELGPVLVHKQDTYPKFAPKPDGTWEYEGRISRDDAAVIMFGSKGAAERIAKASPAP